MDMRLDLADTIIYIDMPRLLCEYRAIKRSIVDKGKTRPDITEGCLERFDWEFFKWIWRYPVNNKPDIMKKIDKYKNNKKIYILKNKYDIEEFLTTVCSNIEFEYQNI